MQCPGSKTLAGSSAPSPREIRTINDVGESTDNSNTDNLFDLDDPNPTNHSANITASADVSEPEQNRSATGNETATNIETNLGDISDHAIEDAQVSEQETTMANNEVDDTEGGLSTLFPFKFNTDVESSITDHTTYYATITQSTEILFTELIEASEPIESNPLKSANFSQESQIINILPAIEPAGQVESVSAVQGITDNDEQTVSVPDYAEEDHSDDTSGSDAVSTTSFTSCSHPDQIITTNFPSSFAPEDDAEIVSDGVSNGFNSVSDPFMPPVPQNDDPQQVSLSPFDFAFDGKLNEDDPRSSNFRDYVPPSPEEIEVLDVDEARMEEARRGEAARAAKEVECSKMIEKAQKAAEIEKILVETHEIIRDDLIPHRCVDRPPHPPGIIVPWGPYNPVPIRLEDFRENDPWLPNAQSNPDGFIKLTGIQKRWAYLEKYYNFPIYHISKELMVSKHHFRHPHHITMLFNNFCGYANCKASTCSHSRPDHHWLWDELDPVLPEIQGMPPKYVRRALTTFSERRAMETAAFVGSLRPRVIVQDASQQILQGDTPQQPIFTQDSPRYPVPSEDTDTLARLDELTIVTADIQEKIKLAAQRKAEDVVLFQEALALTTNPPAEQSTSGADAGPSMISEVLDVQKPEANDGTNQLLDDGVHAACLMQHNNGHFGLQELNYPIQRKVSRFAQVFQKQKEEIPAEHETSQDSIPERNDFEGRIDTSSGEAEDEESTFGTSLGSIEESSTPETVSAESLEVNTSQKVSEVASPPSSTDSVFPPAYVYVVVAYTDELHQERTEDFEILSPNFHDEHGRVMVMGLVELHPEIHMSDSAAAFETEGWVSIGLCDPMSPGISNDDDDDDDDNSSSQVEVGEHQFAKFLKDAMGAGIAEAFEFKEDLSDFINMVDDGNQSRRNNYTGPNPKVSEIAAALTGKNVGDGISVPNIPEKEDLNVMIDREFLPILHGQHNEELIGAVMLDADVKKEEALKNWKANPSKHDPDAPKVSYYMARGDEEQKIELPRDAIQKLVEVEEQVYLSSNLMNNHNPQSFGKGKKMLANPGIVQPKMVKLWRHENMVMFAKDIDATHGIAGLNTDYWQIGFSPSTSSA